MFKIVFRFSFFAFVFVVFASRLAAQTTERAPFALELPELNTGQIKTASSVVARVDVNIVKFWIANPYADNINWSDVRPIINGRAASVICSQRAALNHKVLYCDLNRIAGFALDRARNTFEIEAKGKDSARYYASFVVTTNAKMTVPQSEAGGAPSSEVLRFSGRKFAVIIGVSDYQFTDAGLGNLRYADDDARALYEFLSEPRGGGFNPDDILYLTNEKATLSAVRDSLNRFLTRANETDLVVFFLAGHGTPDPYDPKNLYYLVYDSKVANLKQTALPMLELKQIIDNRLRARRALFLLDTCHSAGVSGKSIVPKEAATGTRQLVRENNFVNQFAVTQLFNQEGRAVLTSSDVNETSRESEQWGGGHGVFTFALLEGFRGKADRNKDKVVTTGELFDYVHNRVQQETQQQQNPRALPGMNDALEIARVQ